MLVGSHSFEGFLIINIDDKTYTKEIFMGQNLNSYIYKILNHLNTFLPKEIDMPIIGVNRKE